VTSAPSMQSAAPATTAVADGDHGLRYTVKPDAPLTGHVDGGWWPRSRDLATELPTLLTALAARMGPVERVSFNLTDWGPSARKVVVDGAVVRLAGYRSQPADTVDVISARQRVTLLVVPPEAAGAAAERALRTSGQGGNTDTTEELLTP
jgi:hypothetical protein